eukprot:scaffold24918_cov27-Tisochrysis_lutea.AAC.1
MQPPSQSTHSWLSAIAHPSQSYAPRSRRLSSLSTSKDRTGPPGPSTSSADAQGAWGALARRKTEDCAAVSAERKGITLWGARRSAGSRATSRSRLRQQPTESAEHPTDHPPCRHAWPSSSTSSRGEHPDAIARARGGGGWILDFTTDFRSQ